MRILIVVAASALVGRSLAEAQAPALVRPGVGLCAREPYSSMRCASIIERAQIRLSAGRVQREGDTLTLLLLNGHRVIVSPQFSGDEKQFPYYLGRLDAPQYYVLFIQRYESSLIQLVNLRTGWSTYVRELPVFSPDRRRFVVAEKNTEVYDPQRLQVWCVDADSLRLEWGLTPENDSWIPDSVKWISNSSFRFVRAGPPDDPEQWTPDTAKFTYHARWSTARP